ncbi:response regulator [Paludicola sp. MB14-C6]|uniref:response regulator n=1 Tax=Paludihabitans sp. MB14-C6 TaxID=3070656 RepID=UPI0027DE0AEA|nr:response regulator [Paludicola sp. MB14-C6]WMJ21840.1 response regulator [Paludicola sp. MB14-C6]
MSLYRVLLVDDEEEIRIGIQKKINWDSLGLVLVGNAANGVDALEMATVLHPDIVLTDIKMPYMDGLTLCKRLIEQNFAVKLVVFSGFDEFSYVKQAMQFNAVDYILKPINSAELTEILRKLKSTLDAEIDAKRDLETLREYYRNSLPVMREEFLLRIIQGRVPSQQLFSQAKQLDITFSSPFHCVIVFKTEKVSKNEPFESNTDSELIPLSAKRIVDENLSSKFPIQSFMYGENIVTIVGLENETLILEAIDCANQICKQANRISQFTLCAGVSSVCNKLSSLHYAYKTALNAMDYRVIVGSGKAIYIDDLEPNFVKTIEFEEQDERNLTTAIKVGSADSMKETIKSIISHLREKKLSIESCQSFLMGIMATLTRLIRGYQLDQAMVFGKNFKGYICVTDFSSLDEVEEWLLNSCIKINKLICELRTSTLQTMANMAKAYIQENYASAELSVETLCEYLHLSSAYFSTIFKRETGMTFINYLTFVRMEAAAKLLKTTDSKTNVIAQLVGYTDPNYFSYVFKKYHGMSPSKYRE